MGRILCSRLSAPLEDRQRQADLLDQLSVGHGSAVLPQHPLDDLGLVGVESAAEGGGHGRDIHTGELKAGAPKPYRLSWVSARPNPRLLTML